MKHPTTTTVVLLSFFLLAQIIGVGLLAIHLNVEETFDPQTSERIVEVSSPGTVLGDSPDLDPTSTFFTLIFAVGIGTILALFLVKFRSVRVWKTWYGLAIFIALSVAFGVILPEGIALLIAGIIAILRVLKPHTIIQNFSELFIYAGITVIFAPLLTPILGVILLLLIALYDAYAVWKSEHMIALAEFQTSTNTFAGLSFKVRKNEEKTLKRVSTQKKNTSKNEEHHSAILGGGDIAFPLLFSGIVFISLLGKYSLAESLIRVSLITVFATISLGILFLISKKKTYYPAMPFLTAGCLLAFGILSIS